MNRNRQKTWFGIIIGVAVLIVAAVFCVRTVGNLLPESDTFSKPSNAIEISVVYAPEEELYIKDAIFQFNKAGAYGRNPITGKDLARGERPIWVVGKSGSSGTVAEGIRNALIAPNNTNVEKPTIFSPSVRHWLALVNYQTGQRIFDVDGAPATANAPVVMAIWESRLKALQAKHGNDIGWRELTTLFNSPNGWRDYGFQGRSAIYYGHTDPAISSTALSTLMAEFYASARYNAGVSDGSKLTIDQVNNPKVQDGVRQIERLIKHYSARTTEFKEYIAQGLDYVDFVALEENDLIFINMGKTQAKPPEKLVALYPKEGTFSHDHPFAVPNAPWVTEEQRQAAKTFTDYVLSKPIQEKVLQAGFRPVTKDVPLVGPISAENGVDPNQPRAFLPVPDPATIASVQQSWQLVKKQADILILVDTSGSMNDENKINQAKEAVRVFLEDQTSKNNVGLIEFNTTVRPLTPLGSLETNRAQIINQVNGLRASGNTALYDALLVAVKEVATRPDSSRIQAILLLSDGQDTASKARVNDVVREITNARNGRTPVLVIPIAYGKDADVNSLSAIARASDTKVQSGDPQGIRRLLEIIGSYF
ncbi:MAG: extracellular solute-binding protein [Anaerolineae bacterium]|nr:extracellular solute-binding protein [Anaerolineae bacterium]